MIDMAHKNGRAQKDFADRLQDEAYVFQTLERMTRYSLEREQKQEIQNWLKGHMQTPEYAHKAEEFCKRFCRDKIFGTLTSQQATLAFLLAVSKKQQESAQDFAHRMDMLDDQIKEGLHFPGTPQWQKRMPVGDAERSYAALAVILASEREEPANDIPTNVHKALLSSAGDLTQQVDTSSVPLQRYQREHTISRERLTNAESAEMSGKGKDLIHRKKQEQQASIDRKKTEDEINRYMAQHNAVHREMVRKRPKRRTQAVKKKLMSKLLPYILVGGTVGTVAVSSAGAFF